MKKDRFPDLEKRKFPRLKDNNFILCFLETNHDVGFEAITCDVSAGGLMFETERYISKKSGLKLEVYQPTDRHKNTLFCIPALARVSWTRKIAKDNCKEGENKYRMGVEFLEIKEEDRARIAKYVQENIPWE